MAKKESKNPYVTFYKLKVSTELWQQFKVKCAQNKTSMVCAIISFIKKYIKEE